MLPIRSSFGTAVGAASITWGRSGIPQLGIPTSEPHLQTWAISASVCRAVIPGALEALQDQQSSQTGVVGHVGHVPAWSPSAPPLLDVAVGSWCHQSGRISKGSGCFAGIKSASTMPSGEHGTSSVSTGPEPLLLSTRLPCNGTAGAQPCRQPTLPAPRHTGTLPCAGRELRTKPTVFSPEQM